MINLNEVDDSQKSVNTMLSTILSSAALLHDIGKSGEGFQSKIRSVNSKTKDFVRHDALSAMFIVFVINELSKDQSSELEILKALSALKKSHFESYANDFHQFFSLQIKDRLKQKNETAFHLNLCNTLNSFSKKNYPILSSIVNLVLTHHRSISTNRSEDKVSGDTKVYLMNNSSTCFLSQYFKYYVNNSLAAEADKFLKLNISSIDDSYFESLQKSFSTISIQVESDSLTYKAFCESSNISSFYVLRPFLVYADHLVSSERSKSDKITTSTLPSAATELFASPGGDRLHDHILDVAKKSTWLFRYGLNKQIDHIENSQFLAGMEKSDLPKFEWQDCASAHVLSETTEQKSGFFAVIMASMGYGKTIGACKVLKAASNEQIRFTYALSARSLATQVGISLANDLRIDPAQMAIVIGDTTAKKDGSGAGKDIEEEMSFEDSYSIQTADKIMAVDEADLMNWSDRDQIAAMSNKTSVFITTPVVSITVDYLIRGLKNRGSDSIHLFRLMTSDLVLDEIDSYQPTDMVGITHLVYLSGFYGRKVLAMSASINSETTALLHAAYKKGFEKGQAYHQCLDMKSYLITHRPESCVLDLNQIEANSMPVKINTFLLSLDTSSTNALSTDALSSNQILKSEKAKISLLPFSTNDQNFTQKLKQEIEFAARSHRTTKDEVSISTCFVKFNTTKSCIDACLDFCKLVDDCPNDCSNDRANDYIVVSYHSHLFDEDRSVVEKFLGDILLRKNQYSIFDNSKIKSYIKENDIKDLKIVVFTTSIQETGRDFDYDFCFQEPNTFRSLMQSTGRILRHRDIIVHEPNVFVFKDEKNSMLAHPGINTQIDQYNICAIDEDKNEKNVIHFTLDPEYLQKQKKRKEKKLLSLPDAYRVMDTEFLDYSPLLLTNEKQVKHKFDSIPDAEVRIYNFYIKKTTEWFTNSVENQFPIMIDAFKFRDSTMSFSYSGHLEERTKAGNDFYPAVSRSVQTINIRFNLVESNFKCLILSQEMKLKPNRFCSGKISIYREEEKDFVYIEGIGWKPFGVV